jgi:hypothetical protein
MGIYPEEKLSFARYESIASRIHRTPEPTAERDDYKREAAVV